MTSVNDAIVNAASKHSRLDGVVCTPAINVRKPILKYSGDEFDRVVQVNLRGNFNVLQSAGWLMVPQGFGSIVLFSSIRSIVTEPGPVGVFDDQGRHPAAGEDRRRPNGAPTACASMRSDPA